jgi:hypothetical protein
LGSSLFSVGNLLDEVGSYSAALRLLKVESDINGILPARGGPLYIYFVSSLSRLRSALGGGNCILRSTASWLVPRRELSTAKVFGFFRKTTAICVSSGGGMM